MVSLHIKPICRFWFVAGVAFCFPLSGTSDAAEPLRISTDFPGASGEVVEIDETGRAIAIAPSTGPGWDNWWYVQIDGLRPGEEIALRVDGNHWATPDRAFYSTDRRTWQQTAPGQREERRIIYRHAFEAERAWVAWGPPFLLEDAKELTTRLAAASPDAEAFELAQSREGRPVPALRIARDGARGKERSAIWIQARQHAWETGSSWVAQGMAEWLVSDDPRAESLRRKATIVLVPIVDVDNVERGAGGKDQTPHDHNRDWSDDPHWPEVRAAMAHIEGLMRENTFDLLIDLHNPGARSRNSFFYAEPDDGLNDLARRNLETFFTAVEAEMNGPLSFRRASNNRSPGPNRARGWAQAKTTEHVVGATLEVPWNSPHSTPQGYTQTGRELGLAIERYLRDIVRK